MTTTLARSTHDDSTPMPTAVPFDPEAQVDAILNRHPAVGFGLGVVRDGRLGVLRRSRPGRCRDGYPHHRGHRLPDRLDHQDLHGDRGHAVVGTGTGGPRCAGVRVPPRLPADPRHADGPAGHDPRPADAYRRRARGPSPVRPAQAGLGRQRAIRGADPVARRVLPGRHPTRRRAGRPVRLHEPRVRRPPADRRGRERPALRPIPARAHLRPARDGRQRHRSVSARGGATGDGLHDRVPRRPGRGRPRVGDRGRVVDLLDHPRHVPLHRGAPGRGQQCAWDRAPAGDAGHDVRAAVPAGSARARDGPRFRPRSGAAAIRSSATAASCPASTRSCSSLPTMASA